MVEIILREQMQVTTDSKRQATNEQWLICKEVYYLWGCSSGSSDRPQLPPLSSTSVPPPQQTHGRGPCHPVGKWWDTLGQMFVHISYMYIYCFLLKRVHSNPQNNLSICITATRLISIESWHHIPTIDQCFVLSLLSTAIFAPLIDIIWTSMTDVG